MNTPNIRFKGFTGDWEQRKLSDLVDVMDGDRGKNYPTESDFYEQGHTLFLNASNVTNQGFLFDSTQYITEDKSNSMGNGKLCEDDIVLTSRGSLGHIAWYNTDIKGQVPNARINSGMLILRPKDSVNTSYLHQFMKSEKGQKQIEFLSFGSAQPQLTKKGVEGSFVQYPNSLEEQTKLGEYFANIDNLITLHQRMCDSLKQVKKYMLQKMFPKQGEKVPEIRFAGFTGDWEQRRFGDVGSVSMCKRIFKDETTDEGDIPFFKIGTFGGEPDAYISRLLFEDYKAKYPYPNKGDILLSASGTIGRMVEYNGEEAYFQDSNIVWLSHDQSIDNSYLKVLYEIVRWDGIEGSTIQRLYNDNFLKTKFMMPSVGEQEKIGSYFSNLDNLITLHQRKSDSLKEIKKFMLQNMFPNK